MGMRTFLQKKKRFKKTQQIILHAKKINVLNLEASNCVRHKKKALSVNCAFIFKVCSAQGVRGVGTKKIKVTNISFISKGRGGGSGGGRVILPNAWPLP